jgi:hypothetical protein
MEQVFEDLRDRLSSATLRRRPEEERRMIQAACFHAIKEGAGYKEIRTLIKFVSQQPDRVLGRIKADSPGAPAPPAPPSETTEATSDPLRELFDAEATQIDSSVAALTQIVTATIPAGELGRTLLEVTQDLDVEEKDAKRNQAPIRRIQHAAADLAEVEISQSTDDLTAIAIALDDVIQHAERLRLVVEDLRAGLTE